MLSEYGRITLSGNQIKFLLIVLMLMDHAILILYDGPVYVREIVVALSRVVAPGMIFFLVEGFIHTHNLRKYVTRMALVAIISQFAFAFAFSTPLVPSMSEYFHQDMNVIWGLLWGLLTMAVVFTESERVKWWEKVLFCALAVFLSIPADFMAVAVVAAPLMYYYRETFWIKITVLSFLSFIINFGCRLYWTGDVIMSVIMGLSALLIIPLFMCYSGERGRWGGMKWFYYIFYPAHLFILGLIAYTI